MEQLLAEYWGPLLAVGILAGFLLAGRRGWKRAEAECGPGCICGGENLRRQEQTTALIQAQQQTPAPIVIHAPTSAYQPQQQPQIIVLQAPAPAPQQYAAQPQIIYLQAPESQPRQLPAPQPIVRYEPAPERYAPQETYSPPVAPQSYYPGPEIVIEDYQQPQLPPGSARYLPPASSAEIKELRRRHQVEKKEMERRR